MTANKQVGASADIVSVLANSGLRREEIEALAQTMTVEAAVKQGTLNVNGRTVPLSISDAEADAMIDAVRDFWNRAKVD